MNSEPALILGGIGGLAASALALIIAFGVPITPDQKLALLTFIGLLVPVLVGIATRSQVTPTARVVASVQDGAVVVANPPPVIPPPG